MSTLALNINLLFIFIDAHLSVTAQISVFLLTQNVHKKKTKLNIGKNKKHRRMSMVQSFEIQ